MYEAIQVELIIALMLENLITIRSVLQVFLLCFVSDKTEAEPHPFIVITVEKIYFIFILYTSIYKHYSVSVPV